jgi:hypothetical protein
MNTRGWHAIMIVMGRRRGVGIAVALLAVIAVTALLIVRQHRSAHVDVEVPSQTIALVRQFAHADGDAQVVAGPEAPQCATRYIQLAESDPARLSLTSDAAQSAVAMITAVRVPALHRAARLRLGF